MLKLLCSFKPSRINTRFISVCLLPLLTNCGAPTLYPQGDLKHQILRPRAAYPGKLTNQTCAHYTKSNCDQESVIQYDLSVEATRTQLRENGFVCKTAGKQYKICPSQAGFCRTTNNCNWFTGIFGCSPDIEVLPTNPMPPVTCFAPSVYDWDSIK